MTKMKLIITKNQLINNIDTLEGYLTGGDDYSNNEATALVKRGTCFVAYKIDKELRFAPSRFIGYVDNKLDKHSASDKKDGRETNKAINKILESKPLPNDKLNMKYLEYCNRLGIKPSEKGSFGALRKFWQLDIDQDFEGNNDLTGEFPEGKIVERTHKARERNSQVILLAKEKFKKEKGRLFCQVCGFDFENIYGEIGKDFIEGHHTIAVSEMTTDHKTKVEDIAMLCANCHRMVHKKRPWLTMKDIDKLIKNKKKGSS
jgi:5-methylcytosine-specific restriction protein A